MSLGKAAIATIPGGPEEIIIPDESGQLVQWADVSSLAAAINRYLEDPQFASRCGQNAAKRALEFSPEAYSQKLETALISLLPNKEGK
jgi:glycosyltransferase involved in cell wall biosynthesis